MHDKPEFETMEPRGFKLACGSAAIGEPENNYCYRCIECFAVIGSVGEPRVCRELRDAARTLRDGS